MTAIVALSLYGLYLLVGFGLRTWLQVRATGDSGFRGLSGRPVTPEWWAGILFAVALVAGFLGPAAELLGLGAVGFLEATPVGWVGVAVSVLGIVLTFITQTAMGTNWRIGVAPGDHTDLVTTGPFSVVRNPMFTAMVITGVGLTLMVPNLVSLVGLVVLLVALQLQVRVVEEPYLHQKHRAAYQRYASRTGRFVPGVGLKLRMASTGRGGSW